MQEPYPDDDEKDTTVRRLVSAADCKPAQIKGPTSVFDAAKWGLNAKIKQSYDTRHLKIERQEGKITCITITKSETPEAISKEAARRAAQRPPKNKRDIP